MSYTHLRKDDEAIESFRGAFLKIRKALGTSAFGVNEIRMPPGFVGHEHDEVGTGHEEVDAILEGDGMFTIDGEDVPVGPGEYLRIDPSSTRLAVAGPDGMRFLAIGARPLAEWDGRDTI